MFECWLTLKELNWNDVVRMFSNTDGRNQHGFVSMLTNTVDWKWLGDVRMLSNTDG